MLHKKFSLKNHGARYSWRCSIILYTLHKKIKFSIKDFFSKCDQIRRNLRIWSHLLKKSIMENFIFCAVTQASLHRPNKKMAIWICSISVRNIKFAALCNWQNLQKCQIYSFFSENMFLRTPIRIFLKK